LIGFAKNAILCFDSKTIIVVQHTQTFMYFYNSTFDWRDDWIAFCYFQTYNGNKFLRWASWFTS